MNDLLCATQTPTLGPWILGLTFQDVTREILRDGERDEKKERKKREERTEGIERGEIKRGVGVCCVEAAKTHTQRPSGN